MKIFQKLKIAPSVLAADFGDLGAEIKDAEEAGGDLLHIDVMDGSFVPPITFGACMVTTARSHSSLYLETHLMVQHPLTHFDSFIDAGTDRIIFHAEADAHAHYSLGQLRKRQVSPGIAINPGTPVETIFDVLELCDVVLIMTVNPGWGGQKFIDTSLRKISRLREEIDSKGLPTLIEVDGGINPDTAKSVASAGADILVAGSSIFNASDRAYAIRQLRVEKA